MAARGRSPAAHRSPREAWRSACDRLELSGTERTVLGEALRKDRELEDEVGWLVAHLEADLSGPFLRAYIRALRGAPSGESLAAERAILPALGAALISMDPRATTLE